jgi:hypothetical protein
LSAGVMPRIRMDFSQSELANTIEIIKSIVYFQILSEIIFHHYGSMVLSLMLRMEASYAKDHH